MQCLNKSNFFSMFVTQHDISLGPRRSRGWSEWRGAGLTGEKKRAPGIHCMRMREQRWNSTAAVLFLVMIVHVTNIHIVDSSQ